MIPIIWAFDKYNKTPFQAIWLAGQYVKKCWVNYSKSLLQKKKNYP